MSLKSLVQQLRQRENHSVRSWHLWVSVILALPILIVSLTAVLIAHDKALGLKQIALGDKTEVRAEARPELRQLLVAADGSQWLAAKRGLIVQRGERLHSVAGPTELRALAESGGVLLAGGKYGLYRIDTGAAEPRAERVMKGDIWGISKTAEGWLVTTKTEVYAAGPEGRDFKPSTAHLPLLAAAPATLPEEKMTASKLVMDLHTGQFFFGKDYEWVWIDLIGGAMALLTITGLVMWLRRERQQARLRATLPAAPEAASDPSGEPVRA
ncbi:PepSY-associated TM helix domain-containing protein [Paucibacter sp. XJ19-41]|uniref:PepSY-associated TM helix domain-containing protein n=1 Tax=Paucibacter sp. XJ19-41 TaxID=2927824 RepID=UPI002349E7E0|nr:PepSY-associated TM helix domain-containing protein [Paucibacter sp. XJ19-41]MDC6170321.1 PepSY-associated TM helix domain-containing protein [Paucibacter sp. XJ19-41]